MLLHWILYGIVIPTLYFSAADKIRATEISPALQMMV